MSEQRISLSRRGFLRGVGAAVAVPALESLQAAGAPAVAAKAVTATGAPLRAAFLYVPNGVNVDKWYPSGTGKDYKLNTSMAPLEGLRKEFQVVKGFEQANAFAGPDGAGDHARSSATFLTGIRPKKTAGSDIQLGVSADQIAANHIGYETRFPSLELSCDGVRKSGACDSGYSCAYQFNISWKSETQPMTPESNPRLVFERLFGNGGSRERNESLARRRAEQKSVLDFVRDDAAAMHKELGRNDQQKLDEYLAGVREIERRIEKSESWGAAPDPGVDAPESGIPREYQEHIRLMFDMMLLAYRTDSTRVTSFLLAHDGSNRNFRNIGVPEGHHTLSHHRRQEHNLAQMAKIDRFYIEQLAYFLEKMRTTEDSDGKSLLHNSMVVWGSSISDPDRHDHSDLPVIVAGNAGGKFQPGVHRELGQDTPMTNLYVRMLHEMGAPVDRVGDSTGPLKAI